MPARRRKVAVLAYHAIADLAEDPAIGRWSVPPDLFAAHLRGLREAGWEFVGLDAVLAARRGEGELSRRALLITFDDAYADLLEALPELRRHGAPGVVFAVSGQVGGTNAWDSRGAPVLDLLDAGGLRTAAAAGVEVGSHTRNHRPLRQVPAEERREELRGSADDLEALGLPRPRAFAYPYGDLDEEVAREAADAGYEASFTIGAGLVGAGSDPQLLPRIEVLSADSPRALRWKLRSAGWHPRLRRRLLPLLGVTL